MIIKKIFTIFSTFILIFYTSITGLILLISTVKLAYAEDISSYNHNSSYLIVTIPTPGTEPGPVIPHLVTQPIINWYDFQTITGISMLNSNIDVNIEYKFCINITSFQGWDDIDFINITAWFDNGDDDTIYNNSGNLGGNLNMFLQYENTTGKAKYNMLWPDDEIIKGNYTESEIIIENYNQDNIECHNLTFSFIPSYQFRYAPGDGSWDNTTNAINDVWSWNFKIAVTDSGENALDIKTAWVIDEFGVNSYTEIVNVGIPSIQGRPGENASTDNSTNINIRSNVDYALSVDVNTLVHKTHPTANISNQTIYIRGGNLNNFTNFKGHEPVYFYGSSTNYINPDDNNSLKIISDIVYKCNIPIAQLPGDYYGSLYIQLRAKL